ncbi:MAG: hypothetical protein ACFFD2_16300 [Promethearchaeota archaeon]
MNNEIPDRFIINSEKIMGKWDWIKREKCIVCNLLIQKDEKIGRCPHCAHIAHLDHILEWIKIKTVCPFCKKKIQSKELIKE